MTRQLARADALPPPESCRPVFAREVVDVDERDLVRAAQHDRAAFAPLYQAYFLRVYRYLYQRVGNAPDAEDLTAATFSKALSGLCGYEEQGHFAAWLFGMARHTLQDYHRRRRPEIGIDVAEAMLIDDNADPEIQALRMEQNRTLRRLVSELPDDQREALLLRFFAQLSPPEIAAVLGRSEGSCKMLVHRAMTGLRSAYRREKE